MGLIWDSHGACDGAHVWLAKASHVRDTRPACGLKRLACVGLREASVGLRGACVELCGFHRM